MGQMTTIPVERLDSDKAAYGNFPGVDFVAVVVEGECKAAETLPQAAGLLPCAGFVASLFRRD